MKTKIRSRIKNIKKHLQKGILERNSYGGLRFHIDLKLPQRLFGAISLMFSRFKEFLQLIELLLQHSLFLDELKPILSRLILLLGNFIEFSAEFGKFDFQIVRWKIARIHYAYFFNW